MVFPGFAATFDVVSQSVIFAGLNIIVVESIASALCDNRAGFKLATIYVVRQIPCFKCPTLTKIRTSSICIQHTRAAAGVSDVDGRCTCGITAIKDGDDFG